LGLLLADGREDGGHVIDGVDVVFADDAVERFSLGHVDELERAGIAQFIAGVCPVAGRHDVVVAVALAKGQRQFRTDLAACTRHENLLHLFLGHRCLTSNMVPINYQKQKALVGTG
jgi:hypothetical protein